MQVTVQVPKFDESEELVLGGWCKEVGDQVEVGDHLVVLKVSSRRRKYPGFSGKVYRDWPLERKVDLAVFHYGTLTQIFVTNGQRVKSGQAIASLTPWPCPTPTSTTLVDTEDILKDSPPEKKLRVHEVLHFIGWLVAVIFPWQLSQPIVDVPLQQLHFLDWLIFLPVLGVLLGWTALLLMYGYVQFLKFAGYIFEAETKAWLQTHWSNLPPNCKLVDNEDSPLGKRIRINDGYGFTINLYYDIRTKHMLACRAYPSPGQEPSG